MVIFVKIVATPELSLLVGVSTALEMDRFLQRLRVEDPYNLLYAGDVDSR